jgi:Flp pilus assembly protein TadG
MRNEVTTGVRRGRRASVATGRSGRWERGAVSAEAAAVLPLLVAVAIGLVWIVALAAAQVRVVDATREAARVAARGESEAAAVSHGSRVAPDGTRFSVTRNAEDVRVTAVVEVDGPGGLFRFLPGVEVEAESVAAVEPR